MYFHLVVAELLRALHKKLPLYCATVKSVVLAVATNWVHKKRFTKNSPNTVLPSTLGAHIAFLGVSKHSSYQLLYATNVGQSATDDPPRSITITVQQHLPASSVTHQLLRPITPLYNPRTRKYFSRQPAWTSPPPPSSNGVWLHGHGVWHCRRPGIQPQQRRGAHIPSHRRHLFPVMEPCCKFHRSHQLGQKRAMLGGATEWPIPTQSNGEPQPTRALL